MVLLKWLIKGINKFNEIIAKAFSFLIFLLVLTLTYEVVARYAFNQPTQWSFDATYFLCSLVLVMGLAYTWQIGGHVSVDLITIKLPRRVNAALKVFFILTIFYLCWFNIFRVMLPHLQASWALKERSMTGFMPPIYPYKTWIFAGVTLLLLQGVVEFIKELHVLITGDEPR
ncbi:MAG: TRAP transporter small permease subunit [Desulfatitalea sp.]|nr:TRAP transporter small permease subunit [Desulfatitalea sp.]